ncbi:hypothetical protein [Chitinophaga japonensis]|nr:hypothetical protein [Chitinophaga japonensis]
MQKLIISILAVWFIGTAFNGYGHPPDDYEQKLLDRLSAKLVKAIAHNNNPGKTGGRKQYLVFDDGGQDGFVPWFTSLDAARLWFSYYLPGETEYNSPIQIQINQQINELKENYLNKTKYKDYDIYFVVSGVYYAKNIEDREKEESLDWKNLRTRSFDTDVKDGIAKEKGGQAALEKYVSQLTEALLKKVKQGVTEDMTRLSGFEYDKADKTLIVFKWVMFDITTKGAYDYVYDPDAGNTIEENLKRVYTTHQESAMYVIDGIRYYRKHESDITGLVSFLNRDSNGDITDYNNTVSRNSKLLKDVTNTFLYFYQQDKDTLMKNFCKAPDPQAMVEKIASTYSMPTEGRAMRNPGIFTGMSFNDRKCLLEYLLNKDYCTDIRGSIFSANGCENVLLDVIEGTPQDQKKELLDFFNQPGNYYKLVKKIDDAGGDDNYTEAVFILSNMAERLQYGDSAHNSIDGNVFKWYIEEIGNYRVKIVSDVDATVDEKTGIQFKVTSGIKTRWRTLPSHTFDPCLPFTPVKLVITDQVAYIRNVNGMPVKVGETITVPAIFLQWVVQNEFKKELAEQARGLILTVALFTGTGELVMATSTAARIWAAADIFFTTASVITQDEDVRNYVQDKWGEDGIATLDAIDELGMYVGVAYLTTGIIKSIDNVVQNATTRRIIREMAEDARLRQQPNHLDEISKLLNAMQLEDDLLLRIRNSLAERIAGESSLFTMRYTDDELRMIIANAKKMELPDREIEDIIFNGCRNEKQFTAEQLVSQCNFWTIVKQRGYPNLFNTLQEYEKFSEVLKTLAKKWDLPENSIFVQGSSLKVSEAVDIADIDVAIKVDGATFDNLVDRFKNATSSTGRVKNIEADALKGKISGGMMFQKDVNGSFKAKFWNAFESQAETAAIAARLKSSGIDFQISIIKMDAALDVSPYLKLK